MKYTEYFNLAKPDGTDLVDVSVLNDNADKIDIALHNSGGSSDFVVTYTIDSTEQTATADKTFAEIQTAILAGSLVYAKTTTTANDLRCSLSLTTFMPDNFVWFGSVFTDGMGTYLMQINHNTDGTITPTQTPLLTE